jgi:hypothetical protein
MVIIAVVIIAFTLQNLRVFLSAYSEMSGGVPIPPQPYSLDFGAYYTAA